MKKSETGTRRAKKPALKIDNMPKGFRKMYGNLFRWSGSHPLPLGYTSGMVVTEGK